MSPSARGPRRRRGASEGPRVLRGRSIGIVGLGLIGGSLLKCLSRHRPALHVLGHDRIGRLAPSARRFGAWCPSLDLLVHESDVVVLCVPVPAIIEMMPAIAAATRTRSRKTRLIVSDMGSMKAPLVATASRWRRAFDYVGLHPLAGGEYNGWAMADGRLFAGRTVVYCPAGPRQDRVARELIRLTGGTAVAMEPRAHDRLAAETIGLPHLVAFAAAALRPPATDPHPLRGTSWGSLTRVSVSDPAFVAGLLHPNAINQARVAKMFLARLDALCRLLEAPTSMPLERALRVAVTRRRA